MNNKIIIVSIVLLSTNVQAEIKADYTKVVNKIKNELSNPILTESTDVYGLSMDEPRLLKIMHIKEVATISEKKPLFLDQFNRAKKR